MSNFIRRFREDPGDETLLEIESVNIIDQEPASAINGVGSGTFLCVGEFENGEFAVDLGGACEVTGGTDFKVKYGTLGYVYSGVQANNPCARSRKADGALVAEAWNGNGFIQLANKKYARLLISRVDTSVGAVEFSRLACLLGSVAPTFALTSGQSLVFNPGAGNVTATFTGVVATLNSVAGVYPSTFVGGETLTLAVDIGTGTPISVVVSFTAADSTQSQVIARINAALGYTGMVDAGGGITRFDGRIGGTDGNVQIVAVSSALVTTATGFTPAAAVVGTGNVKNIAAVTETEVNTISVVASAQVKVSRDTNGKLQLCQIATPLTGTLAIDATTTAVNLGFTNGDTATAVTGIDETIPAGSRVRNAGAIEWVTMQSLAVTADNAGPYSVKVRPALDDGSVAGEVPAAINVVPFPVAASSFAVSNPLPVTAALSEPQIDARYLEAIAKIGNLGNVVKETNIVCVARQSNAIRVACRQKTIEASQSGARGRMYVMRPPEGTTRAIVQGDVQPGVGAYRDRRVVYAYPMVRTTISQIAARGIAGGFGFSDDGVINVGWDFFVGSTMSQLPPEENPGQETTFMSGAIALEEGNPDILELTIIDYTNFKREGVAAPKIDGTMSLQSGVTSVDPLINPGLKNISRQRMSDFLGDTLAIRAKAFGKKLQTSARRAALVGEQRAFLASLVNDERLASMSLDAKSGNTPLKLAKGIFRIIYKARTIPSFDAIVIDQEVGENVSTTDAA